MVSDVTSPDRYARPVAKAILLTGPVGVGKTTTLHEIEALLDAGRVPNAILDLDWLAWATPARGTAHDLLVRNLADVWRNLHDAGIAHVAMARMLHDEGEIADVRAALAGCETFTVELALDMDELRERIRRRDSGVELAEHLAYLDRWAGMADGLRADAVIPVDGRTPAEVARDVLGVAGWALERRD